MRFKRFQCVIPKFGWDKTQNAERNVFDESGLFPHFVTRAFLTVYMLCTAPSHPNQPPRASLIEYDGYKANTPPIIDELLERPVQWTGRERASKHGCSASACRLCASCSPHSKTSICNQRCIGASHGASSARAAGCHE